MSEAQTEHQHEDETTCVDADDQVAQPLRVSKEADTSTTAITKERPFYILPAIVGSQFAGTALWFAGNAVLPELVEQWDLPESSLSFMTSSVQFGFIVGTLVFALFNVADWFPPTRVFGVCALFGAFVNAMIPFWESLAGLIVLRFCTGAALAGIYPVGMKVAADWFPQGALGLALGWLVGALAVGSAVPFLLSQIPQSWQSLLWETSALAATGGIVVGCFVPNGPYRKASSKLDPYVVWSLFRTNQPFRSAAFGYFGHMWELYAFWTWCPIVWKAYLEDRDVGWDASVVTFCVVAIGGVGCVIGGYISERQGSARVAFMSLAMSGAVCLLSPLLYISPPVVNLISYLIWGLVVVADSPQFSSLVAQTCPPEYKGTALTIVNCIGFAVTIGSIQLLGAPISEQYLFLLLAPGPGFGLWSMRSHVFPLDRLKDAGNAST
jgi:MFS family permease